MNDELAVDILFAELEALSRLQLMGEEDNFYPWQVRELSRIRDEIRKVRVHFDK